MQGQQCSLWLKTMQERVEKFVDRIQENMRFHAHTPSGGDGYFQANCPGLRRKVDPCPLLSKKIYIWGNGGIRPGQQSCQLWFEPVCGQHCLRLRKGFQQSTSQTLDLIFESRMTPPSPFDMGAEDTNPHSPDVGVDNLDSNADPFHGSADRSTPSQRTWRHIGRRGSSINGQEVNEPSTTTVGSRRKLESKPEMSYTKSMNEYFVKSIVEDRMARRET